MSDTKGRTVTPDEVLAAMRSAYTRERNTVSADRPFGFIEIGEAITGTTYWAGMRNATSPDAWRGGPKSTRESAMAQDISPASLRKALAALVESGDVIEFRGADARGYSTYGVTGSTRLWATADAHARVVAAYEARLRNEERRKARSAARKAFLDDYADKLRGYENEYLRRMAGFGPGEQDDEDPEAILRGESG